MKASDWITFIWAILSTLTIIGVVGTTFDLLSSYEVALICLILGSVLGFFYAMRR